MHKIDTVMLQASQNKFHGHESLQMYMSNKNVIKIMIAWSASVRVRKIIKQRTDDMQKLANMFLD